MTTWLHEEFEGMSDRNAIAVASIRLLQLTGMRRTEFLEAFYSGQLENTTDARIIKAMHYLPILEKPRPCRCGKTTSQWSPVLKDDVFDQTEDTVVHGHYCCFDTQEI